MAFWNVRVIDFNVVIFFYVTIVWWFLILRGFMLNFLIGSIKLLSVCDVFFLLGMGNVVFLGVRHLVYYVVTMNECYNFYAQFFWLNYW